MVDIFEPRAKTKLRHPDRPQPAPTTQRSTLGDRFGGGVRSKLNIPFVPHTDLTVDPVEREQQELRESLPRGRELLEVRLRENPYKPGTAEFDRWILGLREEPTDPEFNVSLRARQGPAARREELRSVRFGHEPGDVVTPGEFEARQRFLGDRGKPVIVGPDGEPLEDQTVSVLPDAQASLASEEAAELPVVLSTDEAIQSGNFVWLGEMTSDIEGIRFGPRQADSYIGLEDAMLLPYKWTPEQVAYAQEAMGIEITGFADQALINGWAQLVASAAGYAQAGRKVDPFMLLDLTFDATQAARRGSGGGGGGGGAAFSLSDTTAFLNSVMLEEAGRESTNAEAEQFHAAFNGAGEVDPTQFAIDWVRSVVGGEAGTFQAATDFYQAMLAVLGAQTQAEEGPQ